jgi:hypothetical protein
MANDTDMMARAEADLRDAENASASAQARAEAAQADAATAAQRAKEMRAVLDWLRAQQAQPQVRANVTGEAQESQATRFGRPVPETSNTDLCLAVLESFGKPATTRQIRDRLVREGHDLTVPQVRGAMRYLARKNSSPVETTPGSGLWRLRETRQAAPFRDAVAGLPAVNGVGGRP